MTHWPNEHTSVFIWPSSFEWILYFERVIKINKEYVTDTICGLQCLKDLLPGFFQNKSIDLALESLTVTFLFTRITTQLSSD